MNAIERQGKNRPDLMNLDAGAHFQILPDGIDSSVISIYVGMKKNEYIVVTYPLSADVAKPYLEPANPVKINCLYQNQFLEFHSKILDIVSHPVDLMILEYPDAMQIIQRRAHQRIKCFISASITLDVSGNTGCLKGIIKDISKGGCLYLLRSGGGGKALYRMGDPVALTCSFPGIMDEQETIGTVIGIQEEGEDTKIRIQFPEPLWWVPPYPGDS